MRLPSDVSDFKLSKRNKAPALRGMKDSGVKRLPATGVTRQLNCRGARSFSKP
jgi:hypothetical protein